MRRARSSSRSEAGVGGIAVAPSSSRMRSRAPITPRRLPGPGEPPRSPAPGLLRLAQVGGGELLGDALVLAGGLVAPAWGEDHGVGRPPWLQDEVLAQVDDGLAHDGEDRQRD